MAVGLIDVCFGDAHEGHLVTGMGANPNVRFFAWISRNRRLWKDPEATLASARAFLYAAAVMILVRRLARSA